MIFILIIYIIFILSILNKRLLCNAIIWTFLTTLVLYGILIYEKISQKKLQVSQNNCLFVTAEEGTERNLKILKILTEFKDINWLNTNN